MSCDCHLEAKDNALKRVLILLFAINGAMFIVELIVGLWADSSGVIADSLDMLADALVYGISLYAIGRSAAIKVGAARWSGWFQILLAGGILLDVIRRAILGSEPESLPMLVVSVCALGANAYCLVLLSKHRDGEVHMRASWIFTRSDVIANAGVIVAAVPWARHDSPLTTAFDDVLVNMAVKASKQATADRYGVSWRAVNFAVGRVAAEALARVDLLEGLTTIAIDEVKYKKGHRYLTIVSDHATGKVVWAKKGRKKKVLESFFVELGEDRAAALEIVTCDGASWIHEVVKVNQRVNVRVVSVDIGRKRIALTMRD